MNLANYVPFINMHYNAWGQGKILIELITCRVLVVIFCQVQEDDFDLDPG